MIEIEINVELCNSIGSYLCFVELLCNRFNAVTNNNQLVHHPKDHGAIGSLLPAEPTPLCYCGLAAFMKQSRHPASAGHAFYCCQLKQRPRTLDAYLEGCIFY